MRPMTRCWLLGWLLSLAACAASRAPQEAHFQLTVQDDQGEPQANVPVVIDGAQVASTDAHGEASVIFQANANRARLAVMCPAGFLSPEPRSVPLARTGRQPPLELQLTCRPEQRSLLLVVRAPQAIGLPVLADGEVIGHVAEDGTLHAILRRAPGSELRVTLDTSAKPQLLPQHPVREISVGDRDELIVFDQPFATARERPRRASSATQARPTPRHIPYAIGDSRY